MLVLSRREGEKILIGDKIVITVVRVQGNEVRLDIQAPREIPIHREEVARRIKREEERKRKKDKPAIAPDN